MGGMYANGYGVSQDDESAVERYRKSANQGHHVAVAMGARAHPLYIKFEDKVRADLRSRGKFGDFGRAMVAVIS